MDKTYVRYVLNAISIRLVYHKSIILKSKSK